MNASKRRKISEATKERAFSLWLSGMSYRKIVSETKMSIGAVNKLIENARATTPNLDDLRDLNRKLMDSGSSVFDAIRGEKLLEEINLLNVDLEDLASFGVLVKKISLEKNIEAEDFVDSAMRLIVLEKQTGKPCEDLVKEFEGLSSRVLERKKKIGQLDIEAKALKKEISLIKDTFAAQGLDWDEGLTIIKNVKDLKAEVELTTNTLDAFQFAITEEDKKLADVENKREQLKASINALEKANIELRKKYLFYYYWKRDEAPIIWQHQIELEDNVKKLTTELGQLQEEAGAIEEQCELLQQQKMEISTAVKDLETFQGALKKQCQKMIETAKKQKDEFDAAGQRSLEYAKERAKEIIKDAEAKRDRILAGIREEKEGLYKQVEILKAEKKLIEAARRLPILHETRKKLEAQ